MSIVPSHGGPIQLYLKEIGRTQDAFNGLPRQGDPAAASVFAAEVQYKAISQLTEAVEKVEQRS